MREYCCEMMKQHVEQTCDLHKDRFDCPDCLVNYSNRFREYGLILHDGGRSVIQIHYCPWCGHKLPESIRHRVLTEVESSEN